MHQEALNLGGLTTVNVEKFLCQDVFQEAA
jgi:hypothetical protein